VAVELAELNRGPRNDGTGPPFDERALADRCPGFTWATYTAAISIGFMQTRKRGQIEASEVVVSRQFNGERPKGASSGQATAQGAWAAATASTSAQ
jgi:hypothetical protein